MQITNSHIHLFTKYDIPEKFLPLGLVRVIARVDNPVLNWVMHNLNPFSDNDTFDRYQMFMKEGCSKTEKQCSLDCTTYYPIGTRYLCLSMDMQYMSAGRVPRSLMEQHMELANLGPEFIKFAAVDPRRETIVDDFKFLVKYHGFRGVKLYPALGYYPYDKRLEPIYEFCNENKLPIVTHGSPSNPVHFKGSYKELYKLLGVNGKDPNIKKLDKKDLCKMFTDPTNYAGILHQYPNINFCIAHFGSVYWDDYIKGERLDNWVNMIVSMIHTFDNFWTDISYTFANEEYWPSFKLMLLNDKKVRERVLFGSDYWLNTMVDNERVWSVKLRAYLGEELFAQIADTNPKVFLKEL